MDDTPVGQTTDPAAGSSRPHGYGYGPTVRDTVDTMPMPMPMPMPMHVHMHVHMPRHARASPYTCTCCAWCTCTLRMHAGRAYLRSRCHAQHDARNALGQRGEGDGNLGRATGRLAAWGEALLGQNHGQRLGQGEGDAAGEGTRRGVRGRVEVKKRVRPRPEVDVAARMRVRRSGGGDRR